MAVTSTRVSVANSQLFTLAWQRQTWSFPKPNQVVLLPKPNQTATEKKKEKTNKPVSNRNQ